MMAWRDQWCTPCKADNLHTVCVDVALNNFNSVQTTVAFNGTCTRQVFSFEHIGGEVRSKLRRVDFYCWGEVVCPLIVLFSASVDLIVGRCMRTYKQFVLCRIVHTVQQEQ